MNQILLPRINIAYIYFQKCFIYKFTLNGWGEKAPEEKIWVTFKAHICEAHKDFNM